MEITVQEAKRLIEDAVHREGEDAHAIYVGMCDRDRNDMVCEVQGGADPSTVARQWCM